MPTPTHGLEGGAAAALLCQLRATSTSAARLLTAGRRVAQHAAALLQMHGGPAWVAFRPLLSTTFSCLRAMVCAPAVLCCLTDVCLPPAGGI